MTGRVFPVGIVGESNYQPAIERCAAGDRVEICRERGNPHDRDALVVKAKGRTIGYIARAHWVRDAIVGEGQGARATIQSIEDGGGGSLGVVLNVELCPDAVTEVRYVPARGGQTSGADGLAVIGRALSGVLKNLFR